MSIDRRYLLRLLAGAAVAPVAVGLPTPAPELFIGVDPAPGPAAATMTAIWRDYSGRFLEAAAVQFPLQSAERGAIDRAVVALRSFDTNPEQSQ
jgi:hypothetical protein